MMEPSYGYDRLKLLFLYVGGLYNNPSNYAAFVKEAGQEAYYLEYHFKVLWIRSEKSIVFDERH